MGLQSPTDDLFGSSGSFLYPGLGSELSDPRLCERISDVVTAMT